MLEARFNGSLMPHQQVGVDWLLRTPNALLADDVGLGKTAQALAALDLLIQQGHLPHQPPGRPRLCRVLWVTDASLIEQTRLEANRFLPHLSVLTSNDPEFGPTKKGQERMQRVREAGVDLVVMSYEKAARDHEGLSRLGPPMLIMDEVSSLKGKGKQFDALCACPRKPRACCR